MSSVIKAAALRGFTPLVDELGGDGAALLARYRLSDSDTEDDDAIVPAWDAACVLEDAANALECPDFGLRLAERQDTRALGPLAVAMENSPTLGEAMTCSARYLFLHSQALTIEDGPDPERRAGVVGLFYRTAENDVLPPQSVELELGLFHRIITMLHGGRYPLRSVSLPHAPLSPVDRYTGFFGSDVRFGQPVAVLRVPKAIFDAPIPDGDETLRTIALEYLDRHFGGAGQTITAQLRLTIRRSLGTAPIRVEAIARTFGMHPRTLQRRLADEGTTFEAVIDEARRSIAERLLTSTDLPLNQVTAMVGLSQQSALTRACRRWFDSTPTRLRRRGGEG